MWCLILASLLSWIDMRTCLNPCLLPKAFVDDFLRWLEDPDYNKQILRAGQQHSKWVDPE